MKQAPLCSASDPLQPTFSPRAPPDHDPPDFQNTGNGQSIHRPYSSCIQLPHDEGKEAIFREFSDNSPLPSPEPSPPPAERQLCKSSHSDGPPIHHRSSGAPPASPARMREPPQSSRNTQGSPKRPPIHRHGARDTWHSRATIHRSPSPRAQSGKRIHP